MTEISLPHPHIQTNVMFCFFYVLKSSWIYLFFPTATTQGTSKPDLDPPTRSYPCWAPVPYAHSSHRDLEREINLTTPPSCLKTEWTLLKFRMKRKPVLILEGWAWEETGPSLAGPTCPAPCLQPSSFSLCQAHYCFQSPQCCTSSYTQYSLPSLPI